MRKEKGFYVGLSTNGTLIIEGHIGPLLEAGFDYVGISIDGIGATHDKFRQLGGALMRQCGQCDCVGKMGLRSVCASP